ncbi:MAG: ectonucleotide pyrophosphatase/phosphodiesterase, partial [Blastocatellia bacterium]
LLLCLLAATAAGQRRGNPLLVISVDGMDYRYLRDADRLGLKIPNLRRLMREGALTEGVTGVFPTVTWPSHTTMITGVTPAMHGIRGNRRPKEEGGDYYWDVSLLKTKTLWQAARAAGLKTAAITWPVTVGAAIDYNLPEYFQGRNGGAMDLKSIEAKATPGLVDKIARVYPSFAQEWMNDRTRALATMYLLQHEKPDLILLHLVDLDAEAHHNGPFTREANAVLEYTDELIGQILAVTPRDMVVAVVSDHGFERIDAVIDLSQAMAREGVTGTVDMRQGYALTRDEAVALWMRAAGRAGRQGVGREIPEGEIREFTPELAGFMVFESAEHHLFGPAAKGELQAKPAETGVHGLWPGRRDYAASLILWGKGIRPGRAPRVSMTSLAARFAGLMGLRF